jgi:hypothetical protein
MALAKAQGDTLRSSLLPVPQQFGTRRIKNPAQSRSDLVAGSAVGGLSGRCARSRELSTLIELAPDGFASAHRDSWNAPARRGKAHSQYRATADGRPAFALQQLRAVA